jgi:aspartyl-tRNA(Asn)/glutamyl-tRNA(Gln) amidotransferase subunit C
MLVSIEGIEKLAALSRISLSREEKERMRSEFDAILGYVAAIQAVSGSTEKHSRSIVAQVNVMREDRNPHDSGIYTEALLSAAPQREGNYIRVKKIL